MNFATISRHIAPPLVALFMPGTALAQQAETPISLQQITITIPIGTSESEKGTRLASFTAATRSITACDQIEAVASQVKGEVVKASLRMAELPRELQVQLSDKPAGTVSEVFGRDDTYRVIIRC